MFGGIAFMVDRKMCVSVGKARIMCRIDPAIHDAVLKRKTTVAALAEAPPASAKLTAFLRYPRARRGEARPGSRTAAD